MVPPKSASTEGGSERASVQGQACFPDKSFINSSSKPDLQGRLTIEGLLPGVGSDESGGKGRGLGLACGAAFGFASATALAAVGEGAPGLGAGLAIGGVIGHKPLTTVESST